MYWLSNDDGEELANCYYLKDARQLARKISREEHIDVYINNSYEIIDVVFAK